MGDVQNISVIVCTYNRGISLATTLSSIAALSLPKSVEWEVVVVDNNSSDDTRAVVETIARQYPGRFRYVFEPRQGKSYALNMGIRHAQGNILAFTDDDVTVTPSWLENLTSVFSDEKCMGCAGRVLADRNFLPPRWFPPDPQLAFAPLALFNLGETGGRLYETPFGNNMAFRRSAFEKYGTFRTDLGPQPGNEIRDEDAEFGARLLAVGEVLYYEPSAVVYHAIPEDRVKQEYYLAWWFSKARAGIRGGPMLNTKWRILGVPLVYFRRLTRWTIAWLLATDPGFRFTYKLNAYGNLGEIVECYYCRHGINTTTDHLPGPATNTPE